MVGLKGLSWASRLDRVQTYRPKLRRRRRRGRKQKQQEYSKPPQQVTNAFEFVVSEGRYYVDGVLCENDRERYVFTIPGDIRGTDRDYTTYIFYLDIWEREVTYLEDG